VSTSDPKLYLFRLGRLSVHVPAFEPASFLHERGAAPVATHGCRTAKRHHARD
jgi:hypothetical protein